MGIVPGLTAMGLDVTLSRPSMAVMNSARQEIDKAGLDWWLRG
jgi:hypothetical protein